MNIRRFRVNGIRCILVPNSGIEDTGFSIGMAGARYEPRHAIGITHVLEHLMASENQVNPTYLDFTKRIDDITSMFDAETGKNATLFTFESLTRHLTECIDLGIDVLTKVSFRKSIFDRERSRIVEELRGRDDDVDIYSEEALEAMLFDGHSLGWLTSDLKHHLRQLKLRDLQRWHYQLMRGPMVMVATGSFDTKRIAAHLQKRLIGIQGGHRSIDVFQIRQRRPRLQMVQRRQRMIRVCLGFPTPFGFGDRSRIVLAALNNHLGSPARWSSRLGIALQGESGHVHGVSSNVWNTQETGRLLIRLTVGRRDLYEVLAIIRDVLDRFRREPISEDELHRTIRSLWLQARERRYDVAREAKFFAETALTNGSIITAKQFVDRVRQFVTPEAIKRLARKLLRIERTNLLLVGPVHGLSRRKILNTIRL